MSTLNDLTTLALSRAISAKEASAAREQITPGSYDVDLTVRVKGVIEVSEDTDRPPTTSIPVKEVLALFLARSGCTREHSIALLRECLTEALKDGVTGKGAIEASADIDREFKAAVAEITSSLPRNPVKGAVKAHVTTDLVSGGSFNAPVSA
jgi:hypothetical protein